MRVRGAWVLVALTAACAVARPVVLAASDRLRPADAITAGFPLVDLGALAGAVVGALIVSRRPRHPIGWLFLVGQFLTELGVTAQAYGVAAVTGKLPGAPAGPLALAVGLQAGAFPTLALLGLLFLLAPDGRLPRGRRAWGLWSIVLGSVLHAAGVSQVGTDRVDDAGQVVAPDDRTVQLVLLTAYALIAVGVVAAAASLFSRLRHSDGRAREQLTWITLAAVLLAATGVFTLVSVQWLDLPPWFSVLPLMAAYAAVPVLTGTAILRHQLFDVDVVLNRAIVLALLTGTATVLYVVVVVVVGGPAPDATSDPGWVRSLVVTAAVALALQPVRSRVSRFATRLVYGARAAPYVALAAFTRELQDVPRPREMLDGVAEAIGRTLAASVVRLDITTAALLDGRPSTIVWSGAGGDQGAADPDWVAPIVVDGGTVVGEIAVTMPPGRGLRAPDRQLLGDLVAQIGRALGTVRLGAELAARATELVALTAQLEASRRRLVAARAEERARFEDAIRHVVLPHLQPLPDELRRLARRPVRAEIPAAAVEEMIAGTQQAVEALRTVTRGVFPAQLARRGPAVALVTHLRTTHPGTSVTVQDRWSGLRLQPRLESTLYFATVDLLVTLSVVSSVELTTDDDGRVAGVTVTGRTTEEASADRLRVLTDRLAVFDGTLRTSRVASGEQVVHLELPITPRASGGEGPPRQAEAVRVE